MSSENEIVVTDNKGADALPAISMHPMVAMAMKGGDVAVETLDKLLQVQKDWEANEARKAYAQAMAHFRSEVPSISKNAEVDFSTSKGRTNYKYETLDGVFQAIGPALSSAGLSPTFNTVQESGNITVTCRVTHALGHYEETSMTAAADNTGNKNGIQALGSTVTYLQRYTLKALLGLSAGTDNDAQDQPVEKEYIDKDQQQSIYDLCERNDMDIAALEKYLKSKQINSIEEVETWIYPRVIEKLNEAISK